MALTYRGFSRRERTIAPVSLQVRGQGWGRRSLAGRIPRKKPQHPHQELRACTPQDLGLRDVASTPVVSLTGSRVSRRAPRAV